jgi:hypothetical protein
MNFYKLIKNLKKNNNFKKFYLMIHLRAGKTAFISGLVSGASAPLTNG